MASADRAWLADHFTIGMNSTGSSGNSAWIFRFGGGQRGILDAVDWTGDV